MIDLKRILFATDFSDNAIRAKLMAHEFCTAFGAEMHLLHVIHDLAVEVPEFGMGLSFPGYVENIGSHRKELHDKAMHALEAEVGASWRADHRILCAAQFGPPFVEIIRYARDHDIDLIVVGSHGHTGLKHLLLGGVAEKVVRKAPCPVLTVRPPLQKPAADEDSEGFRGRVHPLPVD
ncbi:MAG: universal stress protein [Fuerstiella sp.]